MNFAAQAAENANRAAQSANNAARFAERISEVFGITQFANDAARFANDAARFAEDAAQFAEDTRVAEQMSNNCLVNEYEDTKTVATEAATLILKIASMRTKISKFHGVDGDEAVNEYIRIAEHINKTFMVDGNEDAKAAAETTAIKVAKANLAETYTRVAKAAADMTAVKAAKAAAKAAAEAARFAQLTAQIVF